MSYHHVWVPRVCGGSIFHRTLGRECEFERLWGVAGWDFPGDTLLIQGKGLGNDRRSDLEYAGFFFYSASLFFFANVGSFPWFILMPLNQWPHLADQWKAFGSLIVQGRQEVKVIRAPHAPGPHPAPARWPTVLHTSYTIYEPDFDDIWCGREEISFIFSPEDICCLQVSK